VRNLLVSVILIASSAAHADDARALLGAWLAAQNDGSLDGYKALYARHFSGVRRSGERTVTLDLAGWIRDRTRMFKKPMSVTADEVAVRNTADGIEVTFVQTWASGSYRDVGPKRLQLVEEDGHLRIAREEMLASTQTPSAIPSMTRPLAVVSLADGSAIYALLHDEASSSSDAGRQLRVQKITLMVKPIAPADRASFASQVGNRLALYQGAQPRCQARIRDIAALSVVVSFDPAPDRGGVSVIAAELEPAAACVGADLAVPAGAPPPVAVPVVKAVEPLRSLALKRFRALPEYQPIQEKYHRAFSDRAVRSSYADHGVATPARWDDFGGNMVQRFTHPTTHATYAMVQASAGSDCNVEAGLWAIFRVAGDRPTGEPLVTRRLGVERDVTSEVVAHGEELVVLFEDSSASGLVHLGKETTVDEIPVTYADARCDGD
jgi:hypothetical protein